MLACVAIEAGSLPGDLPTGRDAVLGSLPVGHAATLGSLPTGRDATLCVMLTGRDTTLAVAAAFVPRPRELLPHVVIGRIRVHTSALRDYSLAASRRRGTHPIQYTTHPPIRKFCAIN